MIYGIALVCTLAGWCAQAYTSLIKKENKLNPLLPLLYGLACIGYAIDTSATGAVTWLVLDLVLAILALIIFVFALKKK